MSITTEELALVQRLREVKDEAGSHSPSLFTLIDRVPEIKIKVDACFLSNPYATDLFVERLTKDLVETGRLRDVLEFYPSQNKHIASVLSGVLHVSADQLFVCNGAVEAIQASIHRFAGNKLVVILPTFSPYYEYIRPDQEVIYYMLKREQNFALDVNNFVEFVLKSGADSVCVINPNNPNGGYIKALDMAYILEAFKDLKLVILDESFIDFAYEDEQLSRKSLAQTAASMPNVVVVKSMSKDFGVAGLRAGYAVMSPDRLNTLLANGYLWNVGGLTEFFFRLFAEDEFQAEYNKVRLRYLDEALRFFAKIKTVSGLRSYESKANFSLVEISKEVSLDLFASLLLVRHGVYVRDCADKVGLQDGNFIRIASRRETENDQLLEALRDILCVVA